MGCEKDQLNCYYDAVNLNCDMTKKLVIKPHPRDEVDYSRKFPNAIIVNKVVTSEVLSFCASLKIDKVVTIYSTSISSFQKAKNMVVLGDEFLNGYNRTAQTGKSIVFQEDLHNGSK